MKEDKKDFNARLNNSKDMPKIVELDEKASKKWGGQRMVIASPLEYDAAIKNVESGKLITTDTLRKYMARTHNTDITCPLTAGIFINICAWASYQRKEDITPYWRVLKTNGELNPKYPEAFDLQIKLLENEGHKVIKKGTKYFVENYENSLINL